MILGSEPIVSLAENELTILVFSIFFLNYCHRLASELLTTIVFATIDQIAA
jgi:energy-converting hydrogenase Eha subunit E